MGWLITAGILLLLAILPLGVRVRYDEGGAVVSVLVGPLKIKVFPGSQKEEKPKKEKKSKKSKKNTQKTSAPQKPKEKKGGSITDFLPLVKIVLQLLNGLRKKLRVKRLEVKVTMGGDDPCDLAVNYGRAWEALGNLWPQLERFLVIKKRNVEIQCDFTSQQTLVVALCDVTITLGRLLWLLVYHGIRALVAFLKIQKFRKGGALK